MSEENLESLSVSDVATDYAMKIMSVFPDDTHPKKVISILSATLIGVLTHSILTKEDGKRMVKIFTEEAFFRLEEKFK